MAGHHDGQHTDLWVQPVDLADRRISIERGFWVQILSGGYRFNDPNFNVPPPLELHVDGRCLFDAPVAAAAYRILRHPDESPDEDLARRLKQAIRWWLRSWLNSKSLTWEDRIVQLRIAVDALVGADKTTKAVEWFDTLFGSLSGDERSDELLWNQEHPHFERAHNGTAHRVPAFEHWFRSFADRRNEIVHEGQATTQMYFEEGSPYNGNHLEVAERVVLEAILVCTHRLFPGYYWRSTIWRAASAAYAELVERNAES